MTAYTYDAGHNNVVNLNLNIIVRMKYKVYIIMKTEKENIVLQTILCNLFHDQKKKNRWQQLLQMSDLCLYIIFALVFQ